MAGQRSRKIFTAVVDKVKPLLAEIEEFRPPEIKKIMEETRGGKFISDEIMVGLEKMSCEVKIMGAGVNLLQSYGFLPGKSNSLTIKTSEQDNEGKIFAISYELSGEITSIKEEDVKMGGKPGITVTYALTAYKKVEDKTIIYDINTKTQRINLGKGDIMSEHRRNVDLP